MKKKNKKIKIKCKCQSKVVVYAKILSTVRNVKTQMVKKFINI